MEFEMRRLEGLKLPLGVLEMAVPPPVLYVRGELGSGPRVAVVGTRRASTEGLAFASKLAGQLVEAGVIVLSGGAKGIDAAAHRGALAAASTGRGSTVVVAPSGFDRPYPAEHEGLFADILAGGGGFVSEHDGPVVARRHLFFRRNELLVAMSDAVVLVQSPLRSGASNACLWARRLGRPLLAVPSSPWVAQGLGCNIELKRGAALCLSSADILRALEQRGLTAVKPAKSQSLPLFGPSGGAPASPPRSAAQASIMECLKDGVLQHIDDLCEATRLSPPVVQLELTTLSLEGQVTLFQSGTVKRRL